jgi:hypothetical protein
MKDAHQTSEHVTEWAIQTMGESVKGDFRRINAVATDTCNAMRAVWKLIGADPRTSHVFCVPCDSHGLQLLIQDLLSKIPPLKEVKTAAEHIVASFKHAPLQYAILKRHQLQNYGKRKQFVLSVASRWGTQAGMVDSVLQNKAALQAYCHDPDTRMKADNVASIQSSRFWFSLEELSELIAPIQTKQKASEADGAHVGYVVERWNEIEGHLMDCANRLACLEHHRDTLRNLFVARRRTLLPETPALHLTAFILNPVNVHRTISFEETRHVHSFLERYGDSPSLRTQFPPRLRGTCKIMPLIFGLRWYILRRS